MENYHILGRIGEGAHGIVFKAKHIQVKLFQSVCNYYNIFHPRLESLSH